MQYVASASGYSSSVSSTVNTSSTLNIQDGDVLVSMVYGNIAGSSTLAIADTGGNNAHTELGWTSAWLRCNIGYVLDADANSSATIRGTLNGDSNGAWGILVLQFRPESGETVDFGGGPASFGSNWDDNPTSAQLTSSKAALWVGGAASTVAVSDPEIGNTNCTGNVGHSSSYYSVLGYRIISTAQSSIAFDCTAGDGTCGVQLLYIEITESGGGSALPAIINHLRNQGVL